MTGMQNDIHTRAWQCLSACDPAEKSRLTLQLADDWAKLGIPLDPNTEPEPIGEPGRPSRPGLVPVSKVPKRGIRTEQGRVILAHALAHIEFNAINLALDAVYRFRDMPREFYGDWLQVAKEEGEHFNLLRKYLNCHDHEYGDYDAHNGLWETARLTAGDVLLRMALVPRLLEARGLDVTPGMMDKLKSVGDTEFVACLEVIHRDEIDHVRKGNHWFRYLCECRGLEPRQTFRELLAQYMPGAVIGPFNRKSRLEAGFTEADLDDLELLEAEL